MRGGAVEEPEERLAHCVEGRQQGLQEGLYE